MKMAHWRIAAISLAATGMAATAAPAAALPLNITADVQSRTGVEASQNSDRGRHDGWERGRGGRDYRESRRDYGEPVYSHTRIWRGRDGRYYCRKDNGTTGLLIGAAVGGVIGHEVAGYGDRTLGAILGAAGGALLGRAIDRSNTRCR